MKERHEIISRRRLLGGVTIIGALALAGCRGEGPEPTTPPSAQESFNRHNEEFERARDELQAVQAHRVATIEHKMANKQLRYTPTLEGVGITNEPTFEHSGIPPKLPTIEAHLIAAPTADVDPFVELYLERSDQASLKSIFTINVALDAEGLKQAQPMMQPAYKPTYADFRSLLRHRSEDGYQTVVQAFGNIMVDSTGLENQSPAALSSFVALYRSQDLQAAEEMGLQL